MDNARLMVAKHRGREAAAAFYESMDYDIYSRPPTGDHEQVFVELGERRAFVDKKMAGIVAQVWRLGLDTAGSCQERPSGKAYIGFCVPGQGQDFMSLFDGVNIDVELKETTTKIQNPKTGEMIELDTANVLFSPTEIENIESHLASVNS